MVEKPFGNDLDSARALNATMHRYFPEDAVYRVDHWLGMDPVTATEVLIRFKPVPHNVFGLDTHRFANTLRFRIWPDAATGMRGRTKQRGMAGCTLSLPSCPD